MSKGYAHVVCPYCGQDAELVTGDKVYADWPDLADRWFWRCVPCDAWVGTHSNSARRAPLGTLANRDLRALRRLVHAFFDPLWRDEVNAIFETRTGAYEWLAAVLGIPLAECHIGMFSEELCHRAINIITAKRRDMELQNEQVQQV